MYLSKKGIFFLLVLCSLVFVGYTFINGKWLGAVGEKMYFFNRFPDHLRNKFAREMNAAAKTWSNAESKFRYKSPLVNRSRDTFYAWHRLDRAKDESGIHFKYLPPWPDGSSTIADTWSVYDEYYNTIAFADIAFNRAFSWTTDASDRSRYDIQTIALHELGHRLGLGEATTHACGERAVMDPFAKPETVQRTLQCDDKKGIQKKYGKKGCSKSTASIAGAGIPQSNREDVFAILNGGSTTGTSRSTLASVLDRNPDAARALNDVVLSHQSTLNSESATVTPGLRADLAPVLHTLETTLREGASGEQSRHRNPTRVADRLRSVRHRLDEVEGMTLSEARKHLLGEAPSSLILKGNVPNPASGLTVIQYELPETATVRIEVYDLMGRTVRTLVEGERQQKGLHREELNATGLSSGQYLYRVTAGDKSRSGRLTVVQ